MATEINGVKLNKLGQVQINVRLTSKHYLPLLEKCKEAGAFARSGITKGEPSVGALLRLIATGEVKLSRQ